MMCKPILPLFILLIFPIALFSQAGLVDIDLSISLNDNPDRDKSELLLFDQKPKISKPMVFPVVTAHSLNYYKYSYELGFFCKFEDAISKRRKFQIDLGLTH